MRKDPYHNIARFYDTLFEPINRGLRTLGMKIFPPKAGMVVLDIGCGTGLQLEHYHKVGGKVYGIDTSQAMLQKAQRKLGSSAHLFRGDATRLPFHDEKFDLVIFSLVLHEMPSSIRSNVISEAIRVMKQRGYILITDFHPGCKRSLKGWMIKLFITLSEIGAGSNHFRNYRDFMNRNGIPGLITEQKLSVEKEIIVSGGNMGLFLLCE